MKSIFCFRVLTVIWLVSWWLVAGLNLPLVQAQEPTPAVPRVESFQDNVNVRNGPGTQYDRLGILAPGQTAAIIGKTEDGLWIKINYVGSPDGTGWVYRPNVRVASGEVGNLPIITEIPPTPTVPPTATPEFGALPGETTTPSVNRLPTFTAPAPLVQPTLLPAQGVSAAIGSVPPALIIIVLFSIGLLLGVLSLLQRQR